MTLTKIDTKPALPLLARRKRESELKDITVRATSNSWTSETFLMSGKDGGRRVTVEIPIEAIPAINSMARRRMAASDLKSQQATAEGPWLYVQTLPVESINAGQMPTPDGEIVALTFDRGLETEISFRLPFQEAEELARLLLSLRPSDPSAARSFVPN